MEPAQSSMVGQASRATTSALSLGSCSPGHSQHRKQSKDLVNKFLELGHWMHTQSLQVHTPMPPSLLLLQRSCASHHSADHQVTGVHNLHLPFPCPHKHPH